MEKTAPGNPTHLIIEVRPLATTATGTKKYEIPG
jgi:hypothetical protein